MIHCIVFSLLISVVMGSSPSLNLTQSIALLVENTLTSTLSLISTLFVAYSMVYLRLLSKGISNQMIFCLLCCSFVNQCVVLATLFILQTSQMVADNTCKFFASVLQFTDLSQCFWILAIGGHIGMSYFIKNNSIKKNYFVCANIFVWGTSLVLSIIPVNNYGKSDIWCTTISKYWDFFTLYIFVAVVAILVIIIYAAIIIKIILTNKNMKLRYLFTYNKNDDVQSYEMVSLVRKMAIYPFLYIVCWIVPFFNRLLPLFKITPPFWMEYVHCFTIPLLGFVNCLYYANDVSLIVRWRNYFRSWGMCFTCIGDEEELINED
ncbi:hypothetical protein, conserved [Entamoeba dispar SAW760]|uniref:G-protein coupled receptors family 2 profile 2 domain-containing protein n=1 Tax=Entamoeba dispar (strain ATCC PRA-260 / SAW760) TaxID=370354 RepID=B0E9K9_ENTDS|nr:uncharacterized protein EDI_130930 [Entamoeba dispar SAW760]EDR28816.1 hypothetical protein, conserved [Entamoeba dispar SAW760]|eukprot:EDR28816.1 hypothetical protein, conserved [Entamoeba dispar SAW760]